MDATKPSGIKIAQVFLTRAFFEHTRNPIELPSTEPVGDLQVTLQAQVAVDDAGTGGVMILTASSAPESTGLYRFVVEMTLVAEVIPEEANIPIREYLTRAGPPTLYPFVRETLAGLTTKGRFGPVWLNPFNFTEMSENLLKAQAEQAGHKEEGPK
jgi:preprotein translocase subunit SecB